MTRLLLALLLLLAPASLARGDDAAFELESSYTSDADAAPVRLGALTVRGGGDLSVRVRLRGTGEGAELESFVLDGFRTSAGPVGLRRLEIRPDGSMDVACDGVLPRLHLEPRRERDGRFTLTGAGGAVRISEGEVRVLGVRVAELPRGLLAHWPPRTEDLRRLTAVDPTKAARQGPPLDAAALARLEGEAAWRITAERASGSEGRGRLSIEGRARIGGGRVTSLQVSASTNLKFDDLGIPLEVPRLDLSKTTIAELLQRVRSSAARASRDARSAPPIPRERYSAPSTSGDGARRSGMIEALTEERAMEPRERGER